jgi:hypothetical protein
MALPHGDFQVSRAALVKSHSVACETQNIAPNRSGKLFSFSRETHQAFARIKIGFIQTWTRIDHHLEAVLIYVCSKFFRFTWRFPAKGLECHLYSKLREPTEADQPVGLQPFATS